jgi:succinate dehydrogenase / fumarate reductase cytochrome b subunit
MMTTISRSTATPPAPASDKKTVASQYALPAIGGEYHFLFRRMHSLTGILFGGYIVVHLLINATLLEGSRGVEATVFQQQVDKIHSLPWLVAIEWVAIILPLIYHTVYGIWITATGQPNVGGYGYAKNWFYLAQRVSAVILVFFIAFHVLSMKIGGTSFTFVPHDLATESTALHLQYSWLVGWVVYPIGILAGTFHLANGFWTAAITWGLTTTATAQFRWGLACVGLFIVTTLAGFGALAGGLGIDLDEAEIAAVRAAQDGTVLTEDGELVDEGPELIDGGPAQVIQETAEGVEDLVD